MDSCVIRSSLCNKNKYWYANTILPHGHISINTGT